MPAKGIKKGHQYYTYKQAQDFVLKKGITSKNTWNAYIKNNKLPKKMPKSVYSVYKKDWKGWGRFFKTNRQTKDFEPYETCKKFALKHKIKTKEQWASYIKNHSLPEGIPRRPSHVYQNEGWEGWPKFLENGNERLKPRSFESAREFAKSLNLKYKKDWDKKYEEGLIPKDIPKNSCQTYAKDWKGWGDFLGSGVIAVTKMRLLFPSYQELKELVNTNNVKSISEYWAFAKEQKLKGIHLPFELKRTYPELKSLDDFFNRTPKVFATDKEIQKYIKNHGIKTRKQYRTLYKLKLLPPSFPLHIRRESTKGKRLFHCIHEHMIDYKTARKWARKQNIKSVKQWTRFTKRKSFPKHIPKNPMFKYKKNNTWISWTDFLGNNVRTEVLSYYSSFQEAKDYARKLKFRSIQQWRNYVRENKTPLVLPSYPETTYKKYGWTSWEDFLGCKIIANQNKQYRSFRSALLYARSLNLKDTDDWFKFTKSGNLPDDIPTSPSHVYQKDFKGMRHWLGQPERNFWKWKKAHRYAINLKLKGQREWELYCRSGKKNPRCPTMPSNHYKEWKGWRDWLYGKPRYRSFEEARKFARSLKFKRYDDWRNFCINQKHKKPKDIPFWVEVTYRKEWQGWPDFLGYKSRFTKYTSYENAKDIVQKLKIKTIKQFKELHKQGKIPIIVPAAPDYQYGDRK